MTRAWIALIALALAAQAAPSRADPLRTAAEAARDRALTDPRAYDFVRDLTTEVGARPAGSEAEARGRDFAVARLRALGFSNVRVETFPITAWSRGAESASLVAPYAMPLAMIGLGGSTPTPPGGVEGPAAVFRTYADLLAAPQGSLSGKIAVVLEPMTRTQDGSGYGAANPLRRAGPSEAARRGAVGYLVRSLATGVSREPHTGALNYAADAPKIPAAAISVIDAEQIGRLADRGAPIRIRLKMANASAPALAWTVLGDLPGGDLRDQAVIVGGHLDSWDPGVGAIDDGAGMAIAIAAARIAGEGPLPLRRTLTVALFGAEEMDFSNAAFTAAHAADVSRIAAIGEIDEGSDRIWKLEGPAGVASLPEFRTLAAVLAPIGVRVSDVPARFGGSDIQGLNALGAPLVDLSQDASRYFDWHHSSEDTLDKIDRDQMNQAVAAWAATLTIIAGSDVRLKPPHP